MTDSGKSSAETFNIGSWTIDGNALVARRNGESRPLEPRAYKVLQYLADRRGQLVTIDELMDAHWSGSVVTPNAVTRIIANLRKVLEDDAKHPRYIETVSRRGYRCIARAEEEKDADLKKRSRPIVIAAFVAAIVGAIYLLDWSGNSDRPTVAVLPFENLTGDAALDYIGDGVAEEVIHTLTQISGLAVSAQSNSFRFKNTDLDLRQTAKELDATYIVDGSVRRNGQNIRLTATLIDPANGRNIWSLSEEHDVLQLFLGQDSISNGVANALAEVSEIDPGILLSSGPSMPDPQAYDLYLRGRHVWHQRGTAPLQPAINYFQEAVRIDPDFGRAWGALATAYLTYPSYSPKGYATWNLAEDAAEKALRLDPDIAEAYAVLATFAYTRRRWSESEALFLQGIERNDKSATSHYWYGQFLEITGKHIQAARHLRRALDLDPTYRPPQLTLAFAYLNFSDFEVASQQLAELWQRGFTTSLSWTGNFMSAVLLGNMGQALEWIEIGPIDNTQKDLLRRFVAVDLGGNIDAALVGDLMDYFAGRPDYPICLWLVPRIGGSEQVLELLDARLDRGLMIENRPMWTPGTDLREHPGFVGFLKRIGLVDYWETSGWGDICVLEDDLINCDAAQLQPQVLHDILRVE